MVMRGQALIGVGQFGRRARLTIPLVFTQFLHPSGWCGENWYVRSMAGLRSVRAAGHLPGNFHLQRMAGAVRQEIENSGTTPEILHQSSEACSERPHGARGSKAHMEHGI
jgi:hypothetical protein